MKILKEEKIEEYSCPKCKGALEFDWPEIKKGYSTSAFLMLFRDPSTGNAWFKCERCNKRYLIEGYAKQGAEE